MAKPKLTFTTDDKTYAITLPFPEADHAVVAGWECPTCGGDKVAGRARRIENHDTYAAEAGCVACRKIIGTIRVKVSTLFGIEEDERVMSMGVKIY